MQKHVQKNIMGSDHTHTKKLPEKLETWTDELADDWTVEQMGEWATVGERIKGKK